MTMMSGCSSKEDNNTKYDKTTLNAGFDTPIILIAYTQNEDQFNDYFSYMQKQFVRYNQLFDKYNDYEGINNIKTINDNAGIKAVKVDKEIIEMVELSKTYYELTNGQFDITLGPVLNLWHDAREDGTKANEEGRESYIPNMDALQNAKACDGFENVEINKEESTIYLNKSCASLDVGSIAKGFATEKVAKKLEKRGMKHGLVNAGGNVRTIGSKPNGEAWSVGAQRPAQGNGTASLVSVKLSGNKSFVTSGDYQRYYLYQGEMMHHIIDPTTLMPARYCRSVIVTTQNSSIADALSTSLFTLSYEDGNKLIKELKKKDIDVEAMWIYDDNIKAPEGVDVTPIQGFDVVMSDDLKKIATINE